MCTTLCDCVMWRNNNNSFNTTTYDPWTQGRPVGCRLMMWKQDPTVGEIGVRKVFLPLKVLEGPRDDQIVVRGPIPVRPDATGDFLNIKDSTAFDAVHTYAVVRQTVTMYERALAVGKQAAKVLWMWNDRRNKDPITVLPYGLPNEANAYYTRSHKALTFGYFQSEAGPKGSKVYTCRSLDVVAHETGHAILDGLKPNWLLANSPPQTGAIHEGFGDLTAIFLTLSQFDMVEAVIADTGANLRDKSFLVDLAEEFGFGEFGRTDGLRNAANDLKVSTAGLEIHDLSCVLTGAVYDILADIFLLNRRPDIRDDAVVLYETSAHVRSLFIRAIIAAPDTNATFADIARAMLNISRNDRDPLEYQDIIQRRFEAREIWVSSSGYPTSRSWGYTAAAQVVEGIGTDGTSGLMAEPLLAQRQVAPHESALPVGPNFEQDRSRCCVTMRRRCKHPEHRGGYETEKESTLNGDDQTLRNSTITGHVRGTGSRNHGRRELRSISSASPRDRASLPPEWVQQQQHHGGRESALRGAGFVHSQTSRGYVGRAYPASDDLSVRNHSSNRTVGRVYGTKNGRYIGVNGALSSERSVQNGRQATVVLRKHSTPRIWSGSLRETVL